MSLVQSSKTVTVLSLAIFYDSSSSCQNHLSVNSTGTFCLFISIETGIISLGQIFSRPHVEQI